MDLTLRTATQTTDLSSPIRAGVDASSVASSTLPETLESLQTSLRLPEFSEEQLTDAVIPAAYSPIEQLTKSVQQANVQPAMLNLPAQSTDAPSTADAVKNITSPENGVVAQQKNLLQQIDSLTLANQKKLSPSLSLLAEPAIKHASALAEQANKPVSALPEQVNQSLTASKVNETTNLLSTSPLPLKKIALTKVSMMDSLNPVASVLLNTSQGSESNAQKIVEWAKVDLASAVNSQPNKTLAASQIGEKLNAILQDRINIQASNNIKTAQIRLDPPDLGHIKLTVSLEGDRVSVNVSAQNSLVREALMQTSERLRHELVNQNFVNVSIDISSGEQGDTGKKQQQHQQVAENQFSADNEQEKHNQDEFIVKV